MEEAIVRGDIKRFPLRQRHDRRMWMGYPGDATRDHYSTGIKLVGQVSKFALVNVIRARSRRNKNRELII